MPTSITTAPGFTHSPGTMPGDRPPPPGCRRCARPVPARPWGELVAAGHGAAGDQQPRPIGRPTWLHAHNGALRPRTGWSVWPSSVVMPRGCTGAGRTRAGQVADVFRVEAVHVLARVDALDQPARIRDARQRQLDQDAVNLRIGVELVDQVEQLGLGGTGRQIVVMRLDADLRRRGACCARTPSRPGRRRPAPRLWPGGCHRRPRGRRRAPSGCRAGPR